MHYFFCCKKSENSLIPNSLNKSFFSRVSRVFSIPWLFWGVTYSHNWNIQFNETLWDDVVEGARKMAEFDATGVQKRIGLPAVPHFARF